MLRAYRWLDYILPLYFIVAFFELYLGLFGISIGVKYFSFIILLLYGMRIYRNCSDNSGIKKVFTIFLCYNLLSVIWYLFNGITIRCYFNEIFNSIPAMFFFYIGLSEQRKDERFFRYFLLSCTICMLIGFYLYLALPGWFISGKTELINQQWGSQYNYTENDVGLMMRFSSYLGDSYEADVYAIFAFGIALSFLYNNKSYFSTNLLYIFIFINLVAAIMTQQRVAMAAVVCYFCFFIMWGYKNNNKKEASKMVLIVSIFLFLIIPFIVVKFSDRMDTIIELLNGRMEEMSFSKATKERNYQLLLLTNHWGNPIFGMGVGSGGSVARSFGYVGVTDCSYIELLYEIGIVGTLMYISILLKTVKRGLKHIRLYIAELCMIGFVVVACIGSNTLTMGFTAILPFWYCMGRIWNPYLINHYSTNSKY